MLTVSQQLSLFFIFIPLYITTELDTEQSVLFIHLALPSVKFCDKKPLSPVLEADNIPATSHVDTAVETDSVEDGNQCYCVLSSDIIINKVIEDVLVDKAQLF